MEKKFKLGPLKKREKKEKASGEKPSIKLARFIIEKQNWIVSVFIAACIFCAVAMLFVEVNYDLTEYLPDTAQSGIGLNKMEDEFGYPGTARIMLKDVTLYEAKQYKDKMEDVDGVDQILWCDSTVNIYSGEDFIHQEDIEDIPINQAYYNHNDLPHLYQQELNVYIVVLYVVRCGKTQVLHLSHFHSILI